MDLIIQPREKFGKAVKTLRQVGLVPAELYGHGIANIHAAVSAKELKKVFREAGENTVVNLVWGQERRPAVIHEIQRNYLDGTIEHVDFYQVRMDEEIKAHVPIEFVGEAPAVKEHGGVLNKTISEIEVKALPAHLPRRFPVDLSGLTELNQSIYVKDIKVPAGVKVLVDLEMVIVTVTPPLKEEEVAPPAAPVDLSQVKVETEEKKLSREKEKGEGESAGK